MGGSSSTENSKASIDEREAESLAASFGALPLLQAAFSALADPSSTAIPLHSLKKCLDLSCKYSISESLTVPDGFSGLLENLGSSIADLFFVSDEDGVSWLEFVRGYNKCSARMSSSMSLNTLLRVFASAVKTSGLSLNLEIESEDEGDHKITGFLTPNDVLMLLWLCWSMVWDSQSSKLPKKKKKGSLFLPDISHIVWSAVTSCSETESELDVWDRDITGLEVQIPAGKFLTWVLHTLPSLPDCFAHFVHSRIQNCDADEDDSESSCESAEDVVSSTGSNLLTPGISWAISLTTRGTVREELLRVCFLSKNSDGTDDENLLYRSSLHGRGMNRFWSNVEGYEGPMLMLISASSQCDNAGSAIERKWTIGAMTGHCFENRDAFYGNSGHLYALSPVFHSYSTIAGKEKNFVYSHLHPSGKAYDPHPKPVGLGFGGQLGNERVLIDEDFGKVILRHHAVDKTYQHGVLFPGQGFLPVEALIMEVEVWGLGGARARLVRDKFKQREELFTEQRRTIDLKTFSNWEDSPEKMMMDMMSNPNAPRKEER